MFGFTADFAKKNPNTMLAVTKALIRAGMWLDENNNANRAEGGENPRPSPNTSAPMRTSSPTR